PPLHLPFSLGGPRLRCIPHRSMTGATNGRQAAPGTIRGDFAMSNQENIIHASSSPEDAEVEINRFFNPGEIFDYTPVSMRFINEPGELQL
ncbi:MAG: hypothetical protein K2G98_05915, partial [Duncaniella sp.]|nr:hypothetical protein [Duncaniella sp.]